MSQKLQGFIEQESTAELVKIDENEDELRQTNQNFNLIKEKQDELENTRNQFQNLNS